MTIFSETKAQKSIAERRRPISIPAPVTGATKTLNDEFKQLRARADALETDRGNAALHRAAFDRELEEMGEIVPASPDEPKTTNQLVQEAAGEVSIEDDRSIVWEANEVRDIAIGLLRKELAIRIDLASYLERWHGTGRNSIAALRKKLDQTHAKVVKGLIDFGYDDPKTNKLSQSRVLPGYVNAHPDVIAARNELRAAENTVNGTKAGSANDREIEELRRLIRSEAARLAGLPVSHS